MLIFVLLGALEAACRFGWVPAASVIPPTAMLAALFGILRSGSETPDILATAARVLAAASISAAAGLLLGIGLHAAPRLRRTVEPVLASWYAIPTIMFYPVLLVLFGVGSGAIVAAAVLLALVAMASAALTGFDRVPPVLLRTARVMRLSRGTTTWRVRLPSAAPYLFTGLKLVIAYSFIGVIATEFILSGSGLGYAIANAYNNFDNRTMYGLMLLVLLLVTASNAALQAIDNRLRRRLS